jgi:hypothetical protein
VYTVYSIQLFFGTCQVYTATCTTRAFTHQCSTYSLCLHMMLLQFWDVYHRMQCDVLPTPCALHIDRVGQNRIFAPCMTVRMVISLLKIPYVHRIWFCPTLHIDDTAVLRFWYCTTKCNVMFRLLLVHCTLTHWWYNCATIMRCVPQAPPKLHLRTQAHPHTFLSPTPRASNLSSAGVLRLWDVCLGPWGSSGVHALA